MDVQNLFPEFIKEGADPNHPDILNQVDRFRDTMGLLHGLGFVYVTGVILNRQ